MITQSQDKDVLFQKIGHVWYVFAEMEGDVIYSALPTGVDPRETSLELYELIEEHLEKVQSIKRDKVAEGAL